MPSKQPTRRSANSPVAEIDIRLGQVFDVYSESWRLSAPFPTRVLAKRERRDATQSRLYSTLAADVFLAVDEGLRVSRPRDLIDHLVEKGIKPASIYCDRFPPGTL